MALNSVVKISAFIGRAVNTIGANELEHAREYRARATSLRRQQWAAQAATLVQ